MTEEPAYPEFMDPELLDLMRASGCIGIFFGIESFGDGNDRPQRQHRTQIHGAEA